VWDVSSVAYKDTKARENGGAGEQTGFRPNLSISRLLSISSPLFSYFIVLRECHCIK